MTYEVKTGSVHRPARKGNSAQQSDFGTASKDEGKWITVKLPRDTVQRANNLVEQQHKKGIHKFDRGSGLIKFVLENGLIKLENEFRRVVVTS